MRPCYCVAAASMNTPRLHILLHGLSLLARFHFGFLHIMCLSRSHANGDTCQVIKANANPSNFISAVCGVSHLELEQIQMQSQIAVSLHSFSSILSSNYIMIRVSVDTFFGVKQIHCTSWYFFPDQIRHQFILFSD